MRSSKLMLWSPAAIGLLFCVVATASGAVPAKNGASPVSAQNVLAHLNATGKHSLQRCLYPLTLRRRKLEMFLLSMAKSSKPDVKASAIYLLGMYRIAGAVPRLIKDISFPYPQGIIKGLPLVIIGASPAANALTRIGMPSVKPIIAALQHGTQFRYRHTMVAILENVEGRPVARFRLKRAISEAPTAIEKSNLTAALAEIPTATH